MVIIVGIVDSYLLFIWGWTGKRIDVRGINIIVHIKRLEKLIL